MGLLLVRPGCLLGLGSGRLGLRRPLVAETLPPAGGPVASRQPDAIAGLSGWWDASSPDRVAGADGAPVTGWRDPCLSIIDRSGGGQPLLLHRSVEDGRSAIIQPRLSGQLGGTAVVGSGAGLLHPALGPDHGFRLPRGAFGAQEPWTWLFVWSRPNWRQGSYRDAEPAVLIRAGGVTVLQADSAGLSRRLTLFPGAGSHHLTLDLERRHTHSVVLRYHPGRGVDVWLDDAPVLSAVPNPLPAHSAAPTLFLHDGSFLGGAQCWFHEAAEWSRALDGEELSAVLEYAGRWQRGPRKGVCLLINGQSNAVNYALNDGAARLLADGVAWHLGALAANVLATTGNPSSYTMQSGHGMYQVQGGTYPGSFLHDPMDGSDPSTWQFGADGLALQSAILSLPEEDRADIRAIVWPWNETDSLRSGAEHPTFRAAALRLLELVRAVIGKQAQHLPLVWWNAIPYGTAEGMIMHRRTVGDLAALVAANVVIGNPQTADSNQRGAVWDETTGDATGGDAAHRDGDDNRRFGRLAAPVVARAILAAGGGDGAPPIPSGIPVRGGPRIIHAYRQDSTTILVTIEHDAGTDLIVPRQAVSGRGFVVAVTTGGADVLIPATGCARLTPTVLRLTLAQPLTHPSAMCGLYYPYGNQTIGRGNAVTDNAAAVAKPAGWDIASELGPAWNLNYPLAATLAAVPISDTPAS